MRVHQIILPKRDNNGVALHMAHKNFAQALLNHWGGYTKSECAGVWVGAQGRIYRDESIRYEVASDDLFPAALVALAKPLFPDQLAFYVATVGEAEIIEA